MKRFLQVASLVFLLVGCSDYGSVVTDTEIQENDTSVTSNTEGELKEENKKLMKELEEKPNVTSDQLRETMNLSLQIIQAMLETDYDYLESVTASNVTINQDDNSFTFEEHDQAFLQNIEFNTTDYSYHHAEEDGSIVVGFLINSSALEFIYEQNGDTYVLSSYATN
ncbi:hypothetical protein [Alkalihalobacillus trypoxylicola]|uniref:Uncharacterized protein n=1 Tax=Alkalihalobacillus trypoxylicola TaxID=519424 RepID=A0A162CN04_9BACI|nr:hypothetical protein [Alkalihalobacillus trypoxylicola]KYG25611.1 hypothetical protein AZF04_14080 [Alkalihalobacillus trypoxylicola]